MVNVTVVNRHDFIAAYSYSSFLDDGSAKILENCGVGVYTCLVNSKSKSCTSGDNNIVITQVGESHQKLLVLINGAGIVSDYNALANSFDATGLSHFSVRAEFISV